MENKNTDLLDENNSSDKILETNCKCNDECKCGCNCESEAKKYGKQKRCKHCLSLILSVIGCAAGILALIKTSSKPCIPTMVSNTISDSKIRSMIINVIKNDPQTLIDAMSAGIVKQRSDMTKQQAFDVEKYKDEIIKASYTLGNEDAKTSVLCFFDPLCEGCIEFQKTMINFLEQKKEVCFYIVPIAVLGEKSEEVAKSYYYVHDNMPNKFLDFIRVITDNPTDLNKAISSIGLNADSLEKKNDILIQKMQNNLALSDKIHISSVPAIFIKTESGNFTAIEENEIIEYLK